MLRNSRSAALTPDTARQFARAIVMPNLKPPVTTVEAAAAFRERILAAVPAGSAFEPLMTLYLTGGTPPAEIEAAKQSGFVHAVKFYPAGATTNSENGVTDWSKARPALAAMEQVGMPLLLHALLEQFGSAASVVLATLLVYASSSYTAALSGLQIAAEHDLQPLGQAHRF